MLSFRALGPKLLTKVAVDNYRIPNVYRRTDGQKNGRTEWGIAIVLSQIVGRGLNVSRIQIITCNFCKLYIRKTKGLFFIKRWYWNCPKPLNTILFMNMSKDNWKPVVQYWYKIVYQTQSHLLIINDVLWWYYHIYNYISWHSQSYAEGASHFVFGIRIWQLDMCPLEHVWPARHKSVMIKYIVLLFIRVWNIIARVWNIIAQYTRWGTGWVFLDGELWVG